MSMGMLSMVADSIDGTLIGSDCAFDAVSTDTRTLQQGELFFALRGERFDAAAFVDEAARRGAAGAVVEARQDTTLSQVEVADTRRALGDFAREWRQQHHLPVVAVTGSNGKTTVREMIGAILKADAGAAEQVLVTAGNLNNDIGLPLMVLRLTAQHCAAVFEMGANHAGEIGYLATIAQPGIGVVTNAGAAHLEGFGSLDGVAQAKGELFAGLPDDGIAIVNRDDAYFDYWRKLVANRALLTFGLHPRADFRADDLRLVTAGSSSIWTFTMHTPVGELAIELPMAGEHNVRNSLAAAAAATAAGAGVDAIVDGLARAENVTGRLRRFTTSSGAVVFDDSYNANPASVRAAIDFLASQPGETWFIFGDMAELGPDSEALHAEIGVAARDAGIGRLSCVGVASRATATAFGPGAESHADREALLAALHELPGAGVTVLVKGSRCMGLEAVVAALTATEGAG
ncbi:MAG: UDP-N-acetylmuramoyl-tripeptide--D-alanyl-D-alanine ligase [Gammaproteobacteria bacterium]|nr:UDP-N-acetylmuramoyl-tripeptide--D-alanyl-D-alanine ligase [Gammaproteobacteria bacterium]